MKRDNAWEHNNWLVRYLKIQRKYDRKVYSKFVSASVRARKAKTQLELQNVIFGVFRDIRGDILNAKRDVAEAAVRASFEADVDILARVFPTRDMRKSALAAAISRARANVSEAEVDAQIRSTMLKAENMLRAQVNKQRNKPEDQIAAFVRKSVHPRAPGGVSYYAMRMLRTEVGSTFHNASQNAADKPWVDGFDWYLSRTHKPDPGDLCEQYAKTKKFGKFDVPNRPHPNCMCYIVERRVPAREIARGLKTGLYEAYYRAA